jgi:hypothetical protein
VNIETGELDGSLPALAFLHVQEWRVLHKVELLRNWNLAQAQQPLPKIAPLA